MHPELFRVGSVPVRTFGVLVVVGLVLAWWLSYKRARRFGVNPEGLASLGSWMVILGIIGARGFYVAQYWDAYRGNWAHVLNIREGGLTSFGGFLFGLIGLAIWARLSRTPLIPLLDLIAAPALIAIAIGRVGCFFNGCCYGGPTDLPWGVRFPEVVFSAHPAQLYAAFMHLAVATGLLVYERKLARSQTPRWRPGILISLAFIFYGVVRFIYESFRIGASSEPLGQWPITEAHIAAVFVFLIGMMGFVWSRHRRPENFFKAAETEQVPTTAGVRR